MLKRKKYNYIRLIALISFCFVLCYSSNILITYMLLLTVQLRSALPNHQGHVIIMLHIKCGYF